MEETRPFSLTLTDLHWLTDGEEATHDCCLHGTVELMLSGTEIRQQATVSAMALFLLRSLTEDRPYPSDENQLIPCCGFFIIPQEEGEGAYVLGCSNGIDLEIEHRDGMVYLNLPGVSDALVPYEDYRRVVLSFVEQVEAFYAASEKKTLDATDREGWMTFQREWNRRKAIALEAKQRPMIEANRVIFKGRGGETLCLYDFFFSLQRETADIACTPLVTLAIAPFHLSKHRVDLSARALKDFQTELKACYQTLTGCATLKHRYEPGFLLKVEMTKYGHATIEGEIRPTAHQKNRLIFDMECDQSNFPDILEALEQITSKMEARA